MKKVVFVFSGGGTGLLPRYCKKEKWFKNWRKKWVIFAVLPKKGGIADHEDRERRRTAFKDKARRQGDTLVFLHLRKGRGVLRGKSIWGRGKKSLKKW